MGEASIYTDGSLNPRGKQAGWAALICSKLGKQTIAGKIKTNDPSRAELYAVVQSLETLPESMAVRLFTDQSVVVKAINDNWLYRWRFRNWRSSTFKRKLRNADLWRRLYDLTQRHQIIAVKVKSHSGDELHDEADQLAKQQWRAVV